MRLTDLTDPFMFQAATLASSAASGAASIAAADWTMGVFGVPVSVFLAGFAGALVSLSFLPPAQGEDIRKTMRDMAMHVAGGTLLAAFTQPIVLAVIKRYTEIDLGAAGLGVAGILGAVLMALLPIGLKWLRVRFGGAQ